MSYSEGGYRSSWEFTIVSGLKVKESFRRSIKIAAEIPSDRSRMSWTVYGGLLSRGMYGSMQ